MAFSFDPTSFDLDQFKEDVSICRDCASSILDSRASMFRAITKTRSGYGEQEVKDLYNLTLQRCNEGIGPELSFDYIPDETAVSKRKEYANSIRKLIDKRLLGYNVKEMTVHLGTVVTHSIDYLMGPITLQMIIDSSAKEVQNKGIATVSSYVISYEQDRLRRMQENRIDKTSPIKIFAHGQHLTKIHEKSDTGGVKTLIFNLMEMPYPVLHMVDKEQKQVYINRLNAKSNLENFVKKRKSFLPTERRKKKILLEDWEVFESLIDQLRPKNPYELIAGHYPVLDLRNKIESKKLLFNKRQDLIGTYMEIRGASSFCSQAEIYDILFDNIFGEPLIPINIMIKAFGYNKAIPVLPEQEKYVSEMSFEIPVLNPQKYLKINTLSFVTEQLEENPEKKIPTSVV
jgi:hypothetical protein